ncbi:MAG: type IX secretion system sortase PorU [Bacteroidales bacterium]|nr:type IX secretion system sortase PorU [Bacteroidales bacterium]
MKKLKSAAILLTVILVPLFVFSESQSYKRKLNWKGIREITPDGLEKIKVLMFTDCMNNANQDFLPVYFERIPLPGDYSEFHAELKDLIFETIEAPGIENIQGLDRIGNEIDMENYISYQQKKPYATISFVPVRKNEITGLYERLVSFLIEIQVSGNNKSTLSDGSYIDHSVLAGGNWYKISVNNTGIHKITYQQLADMGIGVGSIDPRNIRIYGNGGGMLPEDPTQPRIDDLAENAIFVSGEGDGIFNSEDYILFYGESPDEWKFNSSDNTFKKVLHLYSFYSYYFITTDLGPGKRIQSEASSTQTPTYTTSKFNGMIHYETDEVNLVKSGRTWFGETFDLFNNMVNVYDLPDIDISKYVKFSAEAAARSDISSSFFFYANNNKILTIPLPNTNSGNLNSDYAKVKFDADSFMVTTPKIEIKVVYNKSLTSSVGWLNYYTLNYSSKLNFRGGQMEFRDIKTAEGSQVTDYFMSTITPDAIIWNVSDPQNVKRVTTTYTGQKLVFRLESESLQEFVAYDGTSFYNPEFVEKIQNQNLHSLSGYDMIILTHPLFLPEAQRLADFHNYHDNLEVMVVTPPAIYNEFSSGAPDITGIRDFVKMIYERGTENKPLRYLLLFGDGSYDNKNLNAMNTNYILTWQSPQSINPVSSYVKDDFYGLLDNIPNDDMVDLGIGRFVVANIDQAENAVDKVMHYAVNSDAVMGDWRNVICLIADDEDGNLHFSDAEELAFIIDTTDKNINIDKIYLDAYQQLSTPSGEVYPDVTQNINTRVERGALIMNYVGHGGELGLAHERILKVADVNSWLNWDNMPVFITATCEFSRFDDFERTSAGEMVFLNPKGGGVALFTTTRATYAGANSALNKNFYKFALADVGGDHYRMGDIIRQAKNQSGSIENTSKFALIGDPAMKFAFPVHEVFTLKINGISIEEHPDTIRALSTVTISGDIRDHEGNILSGFNGTLYPTVFDKPAKYTTLGNDPGSNPTTFTIQNHALYKGKASIINGEWEFKFVAPKDIAYNYGFGKFSYYAKNESIDGRGYFDKVTIGGYNENADIDNKGPDVELFINDENFKFGGLTDENPLLFAKVFDENGINTVGSGIGHDITGILDGLDSYILNQYYESEVDSFQRGIITYPFFNLPNGRHTLSLKVWDVFNNSTTAYTEFIVAESNEMALQSLMNYPNPFMNSTTFSFEHNQIEQPLNIKIEIYSLSGRMVRRIEDVYHAGGYRYKSNSWDGSAEDGAKLESGMYIYKLFVRNYDGTVSQETSKLVILK